MSFHAANRAIATPHGAYLVQGLDRFAVGGDLDREVGAAVEAHYARWGWAPKAVIWDDAVLAFRRYNLALGLARVFVPAGDPFLAAALDSSARAAVRADIVPADGLQTSDVLAACSWPGEVVQAPLLARMIGWPSSAPLRPHAPARPVNRARSCSVVLGYEDEADTAISCLHHLRRQRLDAALELILVGAGPTTEVGGAVAAAAATLFGEGAMVRHLAVEETASDSQRCNLAVAAATGDAIVLLAHDCYLLDADSLQTLADWALEPGAGAIGPRLVGDDGFVAAAGLALGPREPGGAELFVHAAPLRYLSHLVRYTNGASRACCAIARATWQQLGGLDEARFGGAFNDADLGLRLTRAGYHNLYVGTVAAHHHASLGEARTLQGADGHHARLGAEHDLAGLPRLNPSAIIIKDYPTFASEAATALCHTLQLYRLALQARREAPQAGPVEAAFEALAEMPKPAEGGIDGAAFDRTADEHVRAVCAAFLKQGASKDVRLRFGDALRLAPGAAASLQAAAARPVVPLATPGEDEAAALLAAQAAVAPGVAAAPVPAADDPDPDRQFTSHGDPAIARAETRLLVFADALGPSQQILFLQALAGSRAAGHVAVRIVTEDDLRLLRSARGPQQVAPWIAGVLAHVRPSAIIFSRFADQEAYRAIQNADGFADVPRLCHVDDDFFALPAVIGMGRYREGRHPRRIHGLSLVAAQADMILASTPLLGERLAALFGWGKIALCPMHEGGLPAPRRAPAPAPVIGYFGAATHDRDLGLIAPALRRIKAARPDLRIEIVGSVARRSVAAELGDVVVRRAELESDYATFRAKMREWPWLVGLAPLVAHPFNAAKTPIKWTEYAAAGIPVIASRTEPYLELGRQGAAMLAAPDEWEGRITTLLASPDRRAALLDASDRLLLRFEGWRRMERRLLDLVARAGARHRLARQAA